MGVEHSFKLGFQDLQDNYLVIEGGKGIADWPWIVD